MGKFQTYQNAQWQQPKSPRESGRPEKTKRILIIGNGFDLAHGLPTTYGDFLWFCELFRVIGQASVSCEKDVLNEMQSAAKALLRGETDAADRQRKQTVLPLFAGAVAQTLGRKKADMPLQQNRLWREFAAMTEKNPWIRYFQEQLAELKAAQGQLDRF